MPLGVTQATLDYLARRLNEVAAQLPATHTGVDPVRLTDDIALLSHHLTYASERALERFAAPETVHLPERHALMRLAEAMTAVAGALGHLTEALDCVSTGFYRQAAPRVETSHLRNDPKALRIIAAEKCGEARARLTGASASLYAETSTPPPGSRLAAHPTASPPARRAPLTAPMARNPR
ncbi:hypothetical protein SHL15_5634 [Streptomyces hygroscopicus subsp. limoneus]|nr:hypothetical protein SHL15_5634 [Streptomyces hygroscopicus subsp. limoneus]